MKITHPILTRMAGNLIELLETKDIRFIDDPVFLHSQYFIDWKEKGEHVSFRLRNRAEGASEAFVTHYLQGFGPVIEARADMSLGTNRISVRYQDRLLGYKARYFREDGYGNIENVKIKGGLEGISWTLKQISDLSELKE